MLLSRADPLDQLEQPHQVERFGQNLDGVSPRGRPGPGPSRQQDDRNGTQPGVPTLAREKLTPIHDRHEIIEQDEIWCADMREHLQRVPPVPGDVNFEALHREELAQQVTRVGIVVDNQYGFRHGRKITLQADTRRR